MIVYISRKNLSGQFSIYKIFSLLSENIKPSIYLEVPFKSSLLGIIGNLAYTTFLRFKYKSVLFHITGDIHYISLVMPRERTVLTIHDLYGIRNQKGLKSLYFNLLWVYIPLMSIKYIFVPTSLIKRQLLFAIKKNRISKEISIDVVYNPVLYV